MRTILLLLLFPLTVLSQSEKKVIETDSSTITIYTDKKDSTIFTINKVHHNGYKYYTECTYPDSIPLSESISQYGKAILISTQYPKGGVSYQRNYGHPFEKTKNIDTTKYVHFDIKLKPKTTNVYVKFNDSIIVNKQLKKKLELKCYYNCYYKINFSKKGYRSRRVEIDTRVPDSYEKIIDKWYPKVILVDAEDNWEEPNFEYSAPNTTFKFDVGENKFDYRENCLGTATIK